MFHSMFDRGSTPVLEQWLHFTSARHKVIANNIANIETPFYKTLDVPERQFRKIMLRAFEEQRESPLDIFEMHRRDGVIPQRGGPALMRNVEAKPTESGILRHVENNVDIDLEMAKMVKNAGMHNLLSTILSQQFEQMRTAISERVR